MEIGMLWFDNDQGTSIPNKVERAARYYQQKYGVNPDLCYVHPGMVAGDERPLPGSPADQLKVGTILVLQNEKILPDHFWIGVRTAEDPVS